MHSINFVLQHWYSKFEMSTNTRQWLDFIKIMNRKGVGEKNLNFLGWHMYVADYFQFLRHSKYFVIYVGRHSKYFVIYVGRHSKYFVIFVARHSKYFVIYVARHSKYFVIYVARHSNISLFMLHVIQNISLFIVM